MTFLELCQRLREKAGIPGAGPSDVVAQSGELGVLVNLIAQAWLDIQNLHTTWHFLWTSGGEITVVPGGGPYNVANFKKFATRPVIDGTDWLTERDYYDYKAQYDVSTVTTGRPTYIMVQPDRKIIFETNPGQNHTVTFDYFRTPQELTAAADVPLAPARHHMAIVWLALLRYAEGEEAGNLVQTAQLEYRKALASLQMDQLPKVHLQRLAFA